MSELSPVLVLESSESGDTLKIEYISSDDIPEEVNGESGFHMFHVRTLTELILKQLDENKVYSLTDDEIQAMAIASSLHDIGKERVPKSILDYPGKLSPVEYDIVKKHSVFGEEMIAEIETDIDPEIIKYAKEIARSHHERYDGSGYPDGLKGDSIPISAQAVALADVFDALTSSRSYKQAFSQDVAIEMIANGMCGVFKTELIDCLLEVVNNNVLVEIREKLKKERKVVQSAEVYVPKKVLLAGNVGYITKEFVEETFYESHVTILGDSQLANDKNLKVFNVSDPPIDALFETYEFDAIVYFSSELSFGQYKKSDAEQLRQMLSYAQSLKKDVRFIYYSSLDGAFSEKTDKGLIAEAKERLCEYYAKGTDLKVRIIRIPYLYSGTKKDDFLYRIFEGVYRRKTVRIPALRDAKCYFMSMYDLSELTSRLIDNWNEGVGILTVNDEFDISFSHIENKILEIKSNAKIDFTGEVGDRTLNLTNRALRNEYGWFSKIPVTDDIEEEYEKYLISTNHKDLSRFEKIMEWIKEHRLFVKLAELFVMFLITELLIYITRSALYFTIVDFRMAYIVILGTMHGLPYGMAAAGLSSISWLIAKMMSGTSLLTIFYEPTNWLAFVFFFLIGALCGYVRIKSDDTIKWQGEKVDLLEEKLIFTRKLYTDTFSEKRDLKKQIIGSKDSFGKIFDVTRSLDTVEPRELYLRIMETFEDILENKSISVYSVSENSTFGRLEVASRDIIGGVARSVSLDRYRPIIDGLGDEIWRNVDLEPGLPMYAAGVYRAGKLLLLIFIWHAEPTQRSLYYVNLLRIMRDLAQMSLLRAYDYNQVTYDLQYIEGTHILNTEAFERELENFMQLAEKKVFSYVQLEVDFSGKSYSEISEMLVKKIRVNDVMGINAEGKLRVLLAQATTDDLKFILPRFEDIEIDIKVVKND